jgi:pimeloyl-ACP methyl ester carboxylesterase
MARRLARSTAAVLAAVLVLFFGVGGWFYAWECNRRVRVPSDPRTAFGLPFREALRLLRVVADEGFPALVLSTVTILGPAETSFALDQGATGVVLIGYSMGGLWPSASCTSRSWRPRFAG